MSNKTVKKEKMHISVIITIILAAIVVVGSFVFALWNKSDAAKESKIAVTVADKQIAGPEFTYYYQSEVNYFVNTYSQSGLLSYIGLDTSKSLSSQQCTFDTSKTWAEYFADRAVESIKETYILSMESEKAGFTPDREDIDSHISEYKTVFEAAAKENGVSLNEYTKAIYGNGVTWDKFVSYLERAVIAEQYSQKVLNDINVEEDAVTKYFNDNKASYYETDYRAVDFTYTSDNEDSKKEAKAKADELVGKITDEESFKTLAWETLSDETKKSYEESENTDFTLKTGSTASTLDSSVSEWVINPERKAGDTFVADITGSHKYTVYYFKSASLRDYKLANFRLVSVAKSEENSEAKANEILEKFNASDKTAEAIEKIITEYDADSNGGVFENISKGSMPTKLNDWIFADGRKAGDTAVVYNDATKDSEVYYVVCYIEDGDVYWHAAATSSVRQQKYNETYEAFSKDYETVSDKDVINSLVS